MQRLCLVLGLAFVLSACGGTSSPPASSATASSPASVTAEGPLADAAVVGVTDPKLRALLAEHWDWQMSEWPVWATTLGDHRFDDRLADLSEAGLRAASQRRRDLLARARALGQRELDDADRTTLELLVGELEAEVASEICKNEEWAISAHDHLLVQLNVLPEKHRVDSADSAAALLARYRDMPRLVDESVANLRRGAAAGRIAPRESLARAVAHIEHQLDTPTESWALVESAESAAVPGWSDAERAAFADELRAIVEGDVRPAFARYLDVVRELEARGRGVDDVGLGALPDGAACYAARIQGYLGLERSADELHALGLAEIDRINGEMRALGAKLFGTDDLATIVARLRSDRTLYFETREEILAAARDALARAKAAIPDAFGLLPEADCVVVEIPEIDAPFATVAYYRGPHPDGAKPGEYFVNTYKPEVRPRFEIEVLTYHESIPGHHLQIAIAQEVGALPAFRRFGGNTAFVEGWGLYSERLAGEMGLYSSELSRMGMLSFEAWRAARLVVDTGIHAKGWTRAQAEDYMRAHTALTDDNIVNEVDRYIAWPGQALAYKVGQLEILRLRALARERLGDRFDLRAFHDVVLGQGGVSLPVLERQVQRWIESSAAP